MKNASPFHQGETFVQEQTGERSVAIRNGRVIADRIPAGAKRFIARQHYSVLGWSGPEGDIWATFLTGTEGFARTNEELSAVHFQLSDENELLSKIPPFAELKEGDNLGVLFIELSTRRRLRISGRAAKVAGHELTIEVQQAYPNCPKYIQRRELRQTELPTLDSAIIKGSSLPEDLLAWISAADTFFVASADSNGSTDASHRGGKPGFVRVNNGALRIPDYPGNSIFNTLGNFALNPRAGLTFVDFENNRQLQMTGDVQLKLKAGETHGETGGTGRWWKFNPRNWIVSPLNTPTAWSFVDASPFNPGD